MSYTIAELIGRLYPFIEYPGIREIIERLKSIESNTDNEATISGLRCELNAILHDNKSEAIKEGGVYLNCEARYALMVLAQRYPLNQAKQATEQEATEEVPAAWPEFVNWLTDTLRKVDVDEQDDIEGVLNYAGALQAVMQDACCYHQLTVSVEELAAWQCAIWRVWLALCGAANLPWKAAGVLVHAVEKKFIVNGDDPERVARKQETLREQEARVWPVVVNLLASCVRDILFVGSAEEREDIVEIVSLLKAALSGEVKPQEIIVDEQVLKAAEDALKAAERITGREAPERDEQLLSVAPQSRFFRPESPRTTSEQNGCWPLSRRHWASEPSLALKNK